MKDMIPEELSPIPELVVWETRPSTQKTASPWTFTWEKAEIAFCVNQSFGACYFTGFKAQLVEVDRDGRNLLRHENPTHLEFKDGSGDIKYQPSE